MFWRGSPVKSKDYHANLADKGFPTPKQKSQFSSPGKNSSGPNSPTSPAVNPNKDAKDESADEAKVEDRFCGTIRFTDIPIPLSAPTDLICEECEKGNAKYYCAGCKQMFCRKCVDLCHPRICAEELMHEHEKNGWIRPVQHGDTSRVVKKDTFFPPDSLCYYEDFSKHRDISRGGSLCTGIKVPDTKGILVKEMPRYRPNDLVLFPDPTTQEEAYGKVISQWEQIHSEAAPAIVRGDGCSVFYYVQTLGFSKDIGDPEAFLLNNQSSLTSAFQEANEASNGLGLEVEPLARERHMARMLDKRIQDAKNTQVLGPKFHFRDVSDRSVLLPEPNPNVTYPGMLAQPSDGKYLGHVLSGHEQLGTEDRLALHYQAEFKRRLEEHEINVDLYASIDDRVEPSLHWRSLHRLPLPAMNRSYLDYLQSNTSLPNNIETALSIYILPETELTTIHERIRVMKEKKQAILHKVFIQRGAVVTKGIMKKRFLFWKNSMAELRRRKMHYCARKIQTRARVWLCRNKLEECKDYWAEFHEQKRLEVHNQFRYSSPDDPYAVSFDTRKFFATHADVNRYARFLRMMLTRIGGFLEKKKDITLRKTLRVWKDAIFDFHEDTMQNNHIDEDLVRFDMEQNQDNQTRTNKTFTELRQEFIARYQQATMPGGDEKWFDGMQHERISALPLRTAELSPFFKMEEMIIPPFRPGRILSDQAAAGAEEDDLTMESHRSLDSHTRSQWRAMPLYDPAQEMVPLPKLPPIIRPKTFRDRLYADVGWKRAGGGGQRAGDEAWRAAMTGPTSETFWLIRDRLLIGQAPFGVAERTQMLVLPSSSQGAGAKVLADVETASSGDVGPTQSSAPSSIMTTISKKESNQKPKETTLTAISALLLHGVDTFVSLLTEQEEQLLEKLHETGSIQQQIDRALRSTRANANDVICYNQEIIARQEVIMDEMPNYGRTDPRYPAAYRQRLRCEARIELAKSNIQRIQSQIGKLPQRIYWVRLGHLAERKAQWTIDDLLPALWQVEDLLRRGHVCFMYSLGVHINNRHVQPDQHVLTQENYYSAAGNPGAKNRDLVAVDDSSGCLGAVLLGRLYHLEPYEVLYRWQRANDTMRGLANLPNLSTGFGSAYRISCPNLPWQKQLIIEALQHSHYPLEYPIVRSQLDPETFTELHRDGYDPSHRNQNILRFQDRLQRSQTASTLSAGGDSIEGSSISASLLSGEELTPRSLAEQSLESDRLDTIMRGGTHRLKQALYFHKDSTAAVKT